MVIEVCQRAQQDLKGTQVTDRVGYEWYWLPLFALRARMLSGSEGRRRRGRAWRLFRDSFVACGNLQITSTHTTICDIPLPLTAYYLNLAPIYPTASNRVHDHQPTVIPTNTSRRSETLTRPPNHEAEPTKLQKRTWRTAERRAEEWSLSATSHTVSMLDLRAPATKADMILQASVKSKSARSSAAPARW
jgi:hypothetical protein